jgi:hypothetical protein
MKVAINGRSDFFAEVIFEGLAPRYAIIGIFIGEMSPGEPQENIHCRR